MENIIIKDFLDQNILLFHCRYVDDCLLLVRKRYMKVVLNKMNSFDSFLKFTAVEMVENKLVYLDTKIVLTDDKLEFEQFRKTSNHDTKMMNYKKAVSPTQYKIPV